MPPVGPRPQTATARAYSAAVAMQLVVCLTGVGDVCWSLTGIININMVATYKGSGPRAADAAGSHAQGKIER